MYRDCKGNVSIVAGLARCSLPKLCCSCNWILLETVKNKQVILDELQLPGGSDKLAELVWNSNSASQCRAWGNQKNNPMTINQLVLDPSIRKWQWLTLGITWCKLYQIKIVSLFYFLLFWSLFLRTLKKLLSWELLFLSLNFFKTQPWVPHKVMIDFNLVSVWFHSNLHNSPSIMAFVVQSCLFSLLFIYIYLLWHTWGLSSILEILDLHLSRHTNMNLERSPPLLGNIMQTWKCTYVIM